MAPASSFIKVQAGQKQSGSRWRKVYARKRRAQERIKKKRRSTEWQAQPNPIHMAIAPSHPLPPGGSNDQRAVPQAPRHYQSAKHRPPALVGSRSQRWGRVPWSGQWDAQEACCTRFNAKYSQGEARPRRWPGRSFQHECAPASTSRPHKKAASPQSTDLRGSWRRHTHCRFLFSVSSARRRRRGRRGRGSRGSKSKILRWAILCWQLR